MKVNLMALVAALGVALWVWMALVARFGYELQTSTKPLIFVPQAALEGTRTTAGTLRNDPEPERTPTLKGVPTSADQEHVAGSLLAARMLGLM